VVLFEPVLPGVNFTNILRASFFVRKVISADFLDFRLPRVTEKAAAYEKKSNHSSSVCQKNCRQSGFYKNLTPTSGIIS